MRMNLPVTDVEHLLADDTMIVSRTDTKGRLTYFNDQFVAASGFSEPELMGQPHNIVRHPDMPKEAFADLWATLKAGKPWAGAVKNRRKDGGFYWVLASATPVFENGEITGYQSIRTKLAADQRAEAERVYTLLRDAKAAGYTLTGGILRKRTVSDRLAVFTGSLRARLTTLVATLAAVVVVTAGAGLIAAWDGNARMRTIYSDRAVPLTQLFAVNDRMKADALALHDAIARARAGGSVGDVGARIAANDAAATGSWNDYLATFLTPDEKRLADAFGPKRERFLKEGVAPALAMVTAGRFDAAAAHLAGPTVALLEAATRDMDRLVALQVEVAKTEFETAQRIWAWTLWLVLGMIAAGLLAGAWLGRSTMRAVLGPLGLLNAAMDRIAQGDFTGRIRIARDDEIGTALRNTLALQSKLGFDRVSQRDQERRAAEHRRAELHRLADGFESALGEVIETVSAASTELEAAAHTLATTAGNTERHTGSVAAASEQASANVRSVAAATEEMSASVAEIGRQAQESARIAGGAVAQARRTDEHVAQLSQAATRIGDVVNLISAVAEQTNLLALNATIEAARAGEAGKGFAVVAQEVKALAAQTGKATGEIGAQIAGMQAATQDSVAAIKEIGTTISRLSEIAAGIAAAVEEQGAATREISRNVGQAAHGTAGVNAGLGEVQRGATETGSASAQVLATARSLAQDSDRLKREVGRFLGTVRAA